jgi:hypothetical protein
MGFLNKLGRLNYGTSSSGGTDYQDTSTMSTQTPAYNEGIQTLVNTYVPPTNVDQQAADQVMRAGQTNVAAQNLANQQAATYANMFPPRTTQATPPTDDTSGVGTGGDDTSGADDTTFENPDSDVVFTTGGTTNTGLSTQDLINDYLQSQGLNMNNLNPAIDYYNIGNIGFNPLGNNNFYNPMNSTIDFSSLPIVTDPNAPKGFAPVGIATLGR